MADIEVDPGQVHSIEVDPSKVQLVGEKSGFFGRLGENAAGLGHAVMHPLDTAKQMLTPDPAVAKESADAFNRGDYGRAAGSLIEDIPLLGPQIRRTEQDLRKGDYGAIGADLVTAAALGKAPGLLKKVPGVTRAMEVAGEVANDPLGLQHVEPGARAATLERFGVQPEPTPAPKPSAAPGIARMVVEKLASKHPMLKNGMMAVDLLKAVREVMGESEAAPTAEPTPQPTARAFDMQKWEQAKAQQRLSQFRQTPPAVDPATLQRASVPFTAEEQALADHVMSGTEPQPQPAGYADIPLQGPADMPAPRAGQVGPATMPSQTPGVVLPGGPAVQPEAPPAQASPATVEMQAPTGAQPNDITGGAQQPRQLITEDGARAFAKSNGISDDAAAAHLQQNGYGIVTRGNLNRMLHAVGAGLGLDHAALSDIANQNYGSGLGKVSADQMLEMYHGLAEKQAMREPLAGKGATETKPAAAETKPAEVEKTPTAAETEAAIRQKKLTEFGNLLNGETPLTKAEIDKLPAKQAVEYLTRQKSKK